jgi:hypothetical protein
MWHDNDGTVSRLVGRSLPFAPKPEKSAAGRAIAKGLNPLIMILALLLVPAGPEYMGHGGGSGGFVPAGAECLS